MQEARREVWRDIEVWESVLGCGGGEGRYGEVWGEGKV